MKKYGSYQDSERRKGNDRRAQERRAGERQKGFKKNNITCERRQVSYVKPFVYYFLQIILLLPVFGMVEMDLNPLRWSLFSYIVSAVWILYATNKLLHVLARQKELLKKR